MTLALAVWIGVALAATPWVLLTSRRLGYPAAVASVVVLGLSALLGILIATAAWHLPVVGAVAVTVGLSGIVGTALLIRAARRGRRPRRPALIWLPVIVGPAVWLAVVALAQLLPGAAPLSWVMQGDSANNILFGREVVADSGIALGAGENPVPLPAGLLGLTTAVGRADVGSADLLRHDLVAFSTVWALLIAVCGIMCALAAGVVARAAGASRRGIAVSTLLGSMLTFSWFVTGYAAEFGFYNTHLALIVLAAAVIITVEGGGRSASTLALLTVTGTLLLAVWSPFIVVPGALGLLVAAWGPRRLFSSRGRGVLVVIGLAQIILYGVLVVLPGLLVNGSALGAPGGVVGFPVVMLPVLALVEVVLALTAMRNPRAYALQVLVVVVLACGAGLGVLLVAAGGRWTYYPHKFAWMASIVFVILLAGLVVPAAQRVLRVGWARAAVAVVALGGMVGFAVAAPQLDTGERRQHPFAWILGGTVMGRGDDVAEQIIRLADRETPRVLWKSGEPYEGVIDFWLLQMQVDSIADDFDLRVAAYNIGDESETGQLCADLALLGDGVEVLTSDPALATDLAAECPSSGAIVVPWTR